MAKAAARQGRVRAATPQVLGWRVATAARVFALALALGTVLGDGTLEATSILLIGLALLATVASTVDLQSPPSVTPLIPVTEGMLAAILVVTTGAPVGPLLVYLAVPPICAGVRTGWLTVVNTALATCTALIGSWVTAQETGVSTGPIQDSFFWVVAGLGVGLLASWQTRSLRALEDAQAPLNEAHRLLAQLHTVSRQLPTSLDSESAGRELVAGVSALPLVTGAVVFVRTGTSVVPLMHTGGELASSEHALAVETLDRRRKRVRGTVAALPLRVGEYEIGAIVVRRGEAWRRADLSDLQAEVDEHGLALDTALLFDDVRALATTEERNRVARDIHDGIAQDVASLGYLIDELSATSDDPTVHEVADQLRAEISRVVGELRHSIFDLRQGVSEGTGLPDALSDHARELGARGDLTVELSLDVTGVPLPARTQSELLRIAQEAIANVRKHSGARTLWVRLSTDGVRVTLSIADDGVATDAPVPREGHYGLHTMRERAAAIDADLSILPRPGGGTVVTVASRTANPPTPPPHPQGAPDDQRAARR